MSFFISDSFQTLTAAFSFGILLQAAIGGAFIISKGHGSTLLQDGGRRLALLLFMVFAVLWAQVDFGTLLIPRRSTSVCQGVLIFSIVADQLARVSLEQFLLWSIARGTKISPMAFVMQGVLLIRLVAGGVVVGFSRPLYEPTCVAQTSLLPASIVVLSLDFIIIGFLIIRAISLGMFKDLRDKQAGLKKQQSKAFILTVAGFAVWTATSVVMILGISGFMLVFKTVLPANGLLILVGMVTVFSNALLSTKEKLDTTPEAQSPFIGGPETTSRELPGGMVASGSPRSGTRLAKNGRLFVVNETPQDSPNQHRDTRGFSRLADDAPQFGMSNQEQSFSTGHGPGYRGSSGVFGSMAAPMIGRGYLARNLPVPSSSVTTETAVNKKSLFAWKSKPSVKAPIRTLGISKPIMAIDGSEDMPFSRVPTTDLVTAAKNERERREAASFARSHPLISNPVTPQPYFSPTAGPSRSAGLMRERMPYSPDGQLSTVRGSTSTSLLPMGAGSSTSASVSPGREEIRRRSPRQVNVFDMKLDEKPMPPPKPQRNNTVGLPSNPRSRKSEMTVVSKEIETQEETTILRVNDIVYKNPDAVNSIFQNAQSSYEALQRPKTADPFSYVTKNIKSSNSMIHRPRPYSRKDSEIERALFPAEPSSGHRRTKSTGSILNSRSSIFTSGKSTTAPPLPAMPRSASQLRKLFPSETRGKSIDEQIQLLFPAPPRSAFLQNRRSSVPSVPRVPSIFMAETPHIRSPSFDARQSSRASKRTTIGSFALLSNASFDASSFKQQLKGAASTLSVGDRTFGDLKSDNLATPMTLNPSSISSSPINYKYSFPVVTKPGPTPQVDDPNTTKRTSTVGSVGSLGSHEDDASTDWASIHSRIPPPVDLRQARKNARSTFIRGIVHDNDQNFAFEALQPPSPSEPESDGQTDIIPVMLDDGKTDYSSYTNSISSIRSGAQYENVSSDWEMANTQEPLADLRQARKKARSAFIRGIVHDHDQGFTFKALASPMEIESDDEMDIEPSALPEATSTWHFRIGDQLPTFSGRKTQFKARKMPAPSPLHLNRIGKPTNIVVHLAEPSPVESPERAIILLQAQLDRFAEPDHGSSNVVSQDGDMRQMQIQDRLRLLETLEREMDEQEDQWQNMGMDRRSVSTTMTNTPKNSDFSRDSSRRGSRRVSQFSTGKKRITSLQARGDDLSLTNSSQSSDNSRASIWQARLAQAQLAYLENAPTLLRKSLNFLAMPSMQMASPTPPESLESGTDAEIDLSSEADSESDIEYTYLSPQMVTKAPAAKLWESAPCSPQAAMGRLWCYPYETPPLPSTPEPPAKGIRPLQRINAQSLQLSSTSLWKKPSLSTNPRVVSGLWRSNLVRPKSILTKRISVKPNRRTRRMTVLPDIVESPVPVPNKTEKLGIFKFPWGETSDQPTYQPTFSAAPFSNFIVDPRLTARSMELEPDITEYSSSFFDDYDDEDDELNISDSEEDSEYSEDELDDGEEQFGDSTLLDIADLLHSNDVPSRQSLFSPVDIVGDYTDAVDAGSASETDDPAIKLLQAPIRFPIPPLSYSPKPRSPFINVASHEGMYFGVDDTSEDDSEDELAVEEELASEIDDVSLAESGDELFVQIEAYGAIDSLWTAQESRPDLPHTGLFSIEKRPSTTARGTELTPQAVSLARTPRNPNPALPRLASGNLWSKGEASPEAKVWISMSLVTDTRVSAIKPSLWTSPSPKIDEFSSSGLFAMPARKAISNVTNSEPASIDMVYRHRVYQSLLPVLGSSTLWNKSQDVPSEHHWISESSVSPPSPSIYSPSPLTGMTFQSERSSYDLFDTVSIRTTSTKASSLWASMSTSTPTWREPQFMKKPSSPSLSIPDFRKSALSPSDAVVAREADLHSRIPKLRRQKSREAFQKSQDINQVVRKIKTEEESDDETSKKAQGMEFMSIRGSLRPSARRPIKQSAKPAYKRIQSSKADWDLALTEALAAGFQEPSRPAVLKDDWIAELNKKAIIVGPVTTKKERATVSEIEWVSALNEAVLAGALHKPKRPTVSKDDWVAELNNKAVIIGPAYTKKVRPVSTEADWNAALEEAIAKSVGVVDIVKTLWTSPSEDTAQSQTKLWSVSSTPKGVQLAQVFDMSIPNIRKALPLENLAFSVLESTKLWSPTQDISTQVDWISSHKSTSVSGKISLPVSPMTWRIRKSSAALPLTLANTLWTAPIVSAVKSPACLFAHMESVRTKSSTLSSSATIQPLDSSALWKSNPSVLEELNWIVSQASEPVSTASSPMPTTWRPQKSSIPAPLAASDLWTIPTDSIKSPAGLFTHIVSTPVKKSTPTRLATVHQLNSNTLWKVTPSVPEDVNWISSQMSEAVTFSPAAWRRREFLVPSPLVASHLWSTPTASLKSPTGLFTHIKTTPAKKSLPNRLPTLQQLSSNELFTPIPDVEQPLRTHWLLCSVSSPVTRTIKSRPTQKKMQTSITWSAPILKLSEYETASKMWTPRSESTTEEESTPVFITTNEPWTRKQRSMTNNMTTFHNQESRLWTSNLDSSRSPKNWLLATTE